MMLINFIGRVSLTLNFSNKLLYYLPGGIGLALNMLTAYKSYAEMNVNHFLLLVIDYQKE